MVLSETCIRRPVLTTLVTATFIVFGHLRLSAAVGRGAAGRRLSRPSRSSATAAGRQRGDHGGLGRRRRSSGRCRRSPASPRSRRRRSLGRTQIIIQFDLNRNIDGAALDVQTALDRRAAPAADRNDRRRRASARSIRAISRSSIISVNSPTLPLSTVDEYAEITLAPADFPASRRRAGARSTARRNSPCACRSIRWRRRRATFRSTTSARVVATTNSNTPVGTLYGPQQNVTLTGDRGAMTQAPRSTATSSSPGATAHRSSSQEVARVIDSVENDKVASWFNDRSRRSCWRSSASPDANTVDGGRSGTRALADRTARQVPAVDQSWRCQFDRSISIRDSVDDVQETLVDRRSAW